MAAAGIVASRTGVKAGDEAGRVVEGTQQPDRRRRKQIIGRVPGLKQELGDTMARVRAGPAAGVQLIVVPQSPDDLGNLWPAPWQPRHPPLGQGPYPQRAGAIINLPVAERTAGKPGVPIKHSLIDHPRLQVQRRQLGQPVAGDRDDARLLPCERSLPG
jgi:hypothetical protein